MYVHHLSKENKSNLPRSNMNSLCKVQNIIYLVDLLVTGRSFQHLSVLLKFCPILRFFYPKYVRSDFC